MVNKLLQDSQITKEKNYNFKSSSQHKNVIVKSPISSSSFKTHLDDPLHLIKDKNNKYGIYKQGINCLFKAMETINLTNAETNINLDHIIVNSVDNSVDMESILLQYFHLKIKHQGLIDHCKLNMNNALQRCNSNYNKFKHNCEIVQIHKKFAPFVTPKCPDNYLRYGCCKCVRKCPNNHLIDPDQDQNYTHSLKCRKKPIGDSNVLDQDGFGTLMIEDRQNYEFNDSIQRWVEKCPNDYMRIGVGKCYSLCPIGWPDLGDYCVKNDSIVFVPYIWTAGDGAEPIKIKINLKN